MTTPSPEDRLRLLLRESAEQVVPAGDGLSRIRTRVVRRKRVRLLLAPAAALATAGVVVAAVALAGSGPSRPTTSTVVPGASGPASTSPSAPPGPSPSCSTTNAAYSSCLAISPVTGLWPFAAVDDVDLVRFPWATTARGVAEHLGPDLLRVEGLTVGVARQPLLEHAAYFELLSGDLALARVGVEEIGDGAWTLTSVQTDGGRDLTFTSPTSGAQVTSPLDVTGRITGVDENVSLRLLTSRGDELAAGTAPAGTEQPWRTTLTWDQDDWTRGLLVATTRSPRDGSVDRLRVVPVTRG